jgi:hypothetical protein
VKLLLPSPERSCLKKEGPGEFSFIAMMIIGNNHGNTSKITANENTISNNRLNN